MVDKLPNSLIVPDTQIELDRQSPKVQTVTKDKLGGIDWQELNLQTNRISKRVLYTLWVEKLVVPTNGLDFLVKTSLSVVSGSICSLLVQFSLTTSLVTIPVFLALWGLWLSVENSHLSVPYLYLVSVFVFGFIISLFF